ncbi:MAG: HEAT repeat domain-containing protein [Treponema sp.]|jgi:hypothetical protein|nr:HEAT repeat domain-containing protein [Treponema sp.]
MLNFKRTVMGTALFITVLSLAAGQEGGSGRELSVEESYLQESVELMIIRESSRESNRDQKMIALDYIGKAIERGNTGEEVRSALEFLSMEGVMSKAREAGRLVNNYPDVRREAAKYLGDLGTSEAKDTLIKICIADPEPMVLQEAVKSLGKIGINDNGETVAAIAWIVTRFDVLNPDNLLALSAIDAFEKIAARNNGIKDPNAVRMLIRISGGHYIRPVQERAKQVLEELIKYNIQNENQGR